MLSLKPKIVCGVVLLACEFTGGMAQAKPLESMDCRHLFVEDVWISDQLEKLQKKESVDINAGQAPAEQGFFVKLDSVPGIGVMQGMTLSPEGKPLHEDSTEVGIDKLQAQLSSVRSIEQRKICPQIGSQSQERTTILDDQVRMSQ
jgi:hypothetical protein